jgi:hypothetical protein
MDPHLLTEIRAQALRDQRPAEAFLTLQRRVLERIEGFLQHIVATYGPHPADAGARRGARASGRLERDLHDGDAGGQVLRRITDDLRRRIEALVPALVSDGGAAAFRS